jgi:hypothetical protein
VSPLHALVDALVDALPERHGRCNPVSLTRALPR